MKTNLILHKVFALYLMTSVAFVTQSFFAQSSLAQAPEKLESIILTDDADLKARPQLEWGRSPFSKPPGVTIEPREIIELKLEAILFDEKDPTAIINGKIVKKGSSVSDKGFVSEIGYNYVLVKEGISLRELTIPGLTAPQPISEIKPAAEKTEE